MTCTGVAGLLGLKNHPVVLSDRSLGSCGHAVLRYNFSAILCVRIRSDSPFVNESLWI